MKWYSESEPWKGFEYVYLPDRDYQECLDAVEGVEEQLPFRAEHMQEATPPHWRITDIIGTAPSSAAAFMSVLLLIVLLFDSLIRLYHVSPPHAHARKINKFFLLELNLNSSLR